MQRFGLSYLWEQGDTVLHAITVFLLLMSLASWIVMLGKALDLLRLRRAMQGAGERFWHADSWERGLGTLGVPANNPFHALAETGQEALAHHRGSQRQLHDAMDVSDWVTRCLKSSIEDAIDRLQSGLPVLASVGSTAPFVGLLGTVWGIYHALIGIGSAGQATLDQVAGPVGEALIMTALGLFVAIPAVLGYNALNRGNRRVISRLNRFAHDLHAYLVTGSRVGLQGRGMAEA
ncbi:MAG TPA: MotA/TolQ/ExbB proton channel family protein [Quisquiliibacterium sp.]|nr:MotA/TolQ/ExbB proton channel family protein [Quisquiliibacterium sp.]